MQPRPTPKKRDGTLTAAVRVRDRPRPGAPPPWRMKLMTSMRKPSTPRREPEAHQGVDGGDDRGGDAPSLDPVARPRRGGGSILGFGGSKSKDQTEPEGRRRRRGAVSVFAFFDRKGARRDETRRDETRRESATGWAGRGVKEGARVVIIIIILIIIIISRGKRKRALITGEGRKRGFGWLKGGGDGRAGGLSKMDGGCRKRSAVRFCYEDETKGDGIGFLGGLMEKEVEAKKRI